MASSLLMYQKWILYLSHLTETTALSLKQIFTLNHGKHCMVLLKPEIYFEKVLLMTNNTLVQTNGFVILLTSICSDTSILSYSNIYDLYIHLFKKTCRQYWLFSWKTDLTTVTMSWTSNVLFKGKWSSKVNLIFIYFSS